ncbi:MAG TPA: RluA family pseudouridine synthase [Thermoflexia bacterium]|nr:RluA family pseudouridine synthase [Thermoflexia bacterium]
MEGKIYTLTIPAAGDRIDKYLRDTLPALSRAAVQRLIAAGEITVNGKTTSAAYDIRAGDEIVVHVPQPEPTELLPQDLPLDVLYEDTNIIVVDKAAGMVVHPAPGHPDGTLVNAILAHCPDLRGVGGVLRPGIVHRLDQETSGVLIVAKDDHALRELQRQFKARTVSKTYVALLIGRLTEAEGLIDAPIGRHPRQRKKMAVVAGGKPSRTRWAVMERLRDAQRRPYTLLAVELLTGRTHQIRVHFSWFGYPLVGDATYGRRDPLVAPRQFLHARDLAITHPTTGERMTFSTPLPADLRDVLACLEVT